MVTDILVIFDRARHSTEDVLCGPSIEGMYSLSTIPSLTQAGMGCVNEHSPENSLLAQEMFLHLLRRLLFSSLLGLCFSKFLAWHVTILSKL